MTGCTGSVAVNIGGFILSGVDIVHALGFADGPVIQVALGSALVLHQVARTDAGGVLVIVGTQVQLHGLERSR